MFMKRKKILSWSLAMAISLLLCGGGIAYAKVTGVCSNCHTMHSSQDGANLHDGANPSATLLKGDCVGCHSHVSETQTYSLGTSTVPVVNFTGGGEPLEYLSGGNFYWVAQTGGDAKGHNVYGIAGKDVAITMAGRPAPGGSGCSDDDCHTTLAVATYSGPTSGPNGCQGCHLNVMHHADDGTGTKYVGSADKGWYRFLSGHSSGHGVAGIEHDGWGPSNAAVGSINHNEYLGVPASKTGTTTLANKSMTAFCCGCHGDFHKQNTVSDGTGSWIRHPSDAVIPTTGEYAAMASNYDPTIPLARSASALVTLGNIPSPNVATGADMVMCLSCHRPHGSPYDDMLRFDYTKMLAGAGGDWLGKGCFHCHTEKD